MMSKVGIDVSHHNGKLNWESLKPQIDFVIIRCGYGGDYQVQDDKYWKYNVSECERLAIPYGVYLYSYANSGSKIQSEIKHVERLLKDCKQIPELGLWIDVEENGNEHFFEQAVEDFYNHFSANYKHVGVYASKYDMSTYVKNVPNGCMRWLAHWGVSECGYDKEFDIWQYTSDGHLYGADGRFDMNKVDFAWWEESEQFTFYPVPSIETNSIVDALKNIGVDSSYDNRKEIAITNAILNYKGTASQNTFMLNLLYEGNLIKSGKSESIFYPVPETYTVSIVDALKSISVDSSMSNRKKIANVNGIEDYTGTGAQNKQMRELLYAGKLKRS